MTAITEPPGLDILNCADGHTEIRFDGAESEIEIVRAGQMIEDMLRRGYVLFVHGPDNALMRVEKFDREKRVYVIADGPLYAGEPEKEYLPGEREVAEAQPAPKRRRPRKTEVPMAEVKATAIGRSAGG